ncbi:MAG: hypothetical protein OEZ02_10865 [Anaerolineae bacterium]|nr:hypothetical protein [Anaerolineae bacterium]
MITNLSNFIRRSSSPNSLLVSFLLLALFSGVLMPGATARVAAVSGGGTILDLQTRYTVEQAYEQIAQYGVLGRQVYAQSSMTVDGLYPLVFTAFLMILLTCIFRSAFAPGSWLQKLHLVPLGAMIFDYLENTGLVILLTSYPEQLEGLARLTANFTTIKWLFIALSLTLIVVGLLGILLRKLRRSKPAEVPPALA